MSVVCDDHALSVVSNFELQFTIPGLNGQFDPGRAGMTVNIHQTFLSNSHE
jgi:hypothetical protein